MAYVIADRVKETTSTGGTGDLTLGGAGSGYRALSVVLANSDTFPYVIEDTTNNTWEVGLGTYHSGTNSFTRTTIGASSNAGSAVNFAAISKNIFIAATASWLLNGVDTHIQDIFDLKIALDIGQNVQAWGGLLDNINTLTPTNGYFLVGNGSSITNRVLAAGDLPNHSAALITTGALALARGGTNVDLSASGSATAILAQDASQVISARSLIAADIPSLNASKITAGALALARGGTNVDLSASGSSVAVLAQDASHVITARSLIAADIPSLAASIITSGLLALARGGTNTDLSGTGGANQFVKQTSVGGTLTVAVIAAADVPSLNASKINAGQLILAQGGSGSDLSATGPGFLKQATLGANVTVATLVAADLPNHSATLITSGLLALARGGTNADLSASGSSVAVLAQDASHVITARSLIAADIPSLAASIITSGQLALARGGTNTDLSGTGGASKYLSQITLGGNITVAIIPAADIPNLAASIITSGTLALARGGLNADVSATGGAGFVLKQTSVGANVTVAALIAADIPSLNASKITAGQLVLAQGGTGADLSATGSGFLKQATTGANVTVAALASGDIPNLDASKITTGALALARGGTNADLSASGSSTSVLAQDASHVITARALIAADIPNLSATIITSGTLSQARTDYTPAVIILPASSTRNVIQASADFKELVVQAFAAQTANIQEWQNSAGTILQRVGPTGQYFVQPVDGSIAGSIHKAITTKTATVTNKSLTANVATLTFASHTFLVGETAVVTSVDATFNGTFVITAVAATTISYALVTANVGSTSSSGTVTVDQSADIAQWQIQSAVKQLWVDSGGVLQGSTAKLGQVTGTDGRLTINQNSANGTNNMYLTIDSNHGKFVSTLDFQVIPSNQAVGYVYFDYLSGVVRLTLENNSTAKIIGPASGRLELSTQGNNDIRLTPLGTGKVGVNGAPTAAFTVLGNQDVVQVSVKGNGTQTSNLQEWTTSTPTVVASMNNAGVLAAPIVAAFADGITGLQITKADKATLVGTFDTTNTRFILGTNPNSALSDAQLTLLGADNSSSTIAMKVRYTSAELITATNDRTFAGSGNWTGTNWAVSAGVFLHTTTNTADAVLAVGNMTANMLITSEVYKVVFTVGGMTAGTLTPKLGTSAGTTVNANGTYTQYITTNAGGVNLIFTPTSTFDGSLDNISVVRYGSILTINNDQSMTIGKSSGSSNAPTGGIVIDANGKVNINGSSGTANLNVTSASGVIGLQITGQNNADIFKIIASSGSTTVYKIDLSGSLYSAVRDAGTNAVIDVAFFDHSSGGVLAAGFGTGIRVQAFDSTTASQDMARIRSLWTTITHASRASRSVASAYDSTGERDIIGWGANGTNPLLGFYPTIAAAPIAQPTTSIAAATFVANSGTTVNDASTFDGYTMKQIVKALRNLGLLT